MKLYRKRPIVIEAEQYEHGLTKIEGVQPCHGTHAHIDTLEGRMEVRNGDWIIRGVKGELYPCKPDIFAETYEPAETTRNVCEHKWADNGSCLYCFASRGDKNV